MRLTKRDFAFLISGVAAGIFGTKKVPTSPPVRHVKYVFQVWEAYNRLRKIMFEEYYRIDEAIAAEEAFLSMTRPKTVLGLAPYSVVTFKVVEEGPDRILRMSFNKEEESSE